VQLAIVGPTASGKSQVALAYGLRRAGLELVSADAMQVYRGMDIGTAKPAAAEQAAVPHHGIDLVDPDEDCTVVRYRAAVDEALAGIAARGGEAVLVGGTGLYVRAVIDRLEPPGAWPSVRDELETEIDTTALHLRLAELDPLAASRMEPTNRRRIVRALEVTLGSGRPFSSFGPGLTEYPPVAARQIGLRWPRAVLGRRIEQRYEQQLADGFLVEVEALAARPGGLSRTARQALGYRELLAHLDGECSLDEAIALAIVRTRRFAVRQERWFRRDPRIRWVDVDDDPLVALPVLEEELAACS
jgi:tRNA dimethylallyltransferase